MILLSSMFSLETSTKMNTQYIFNKYNSMIQSTKDLQLFCTEKYKM